MADAPLIKAEAEEMKSGDIPPLEDEDLEEDAGDLEFFDRGTNDRRYETLYLAHIPKSMWDAWFKLTERLGDDEEVQIGTVRTWNEAIPDPHMKGGVREVTRLRMLLNPGCPEHQLLPHEYDLDVIDRDVQNHFVFSEEDLPAYKAKNKARGEVANAGMRASLLRQRQGNGADHGSGPHRHVYDRRNRYKPYFRKAIPKKTKIFGRVHYDVRVEPRNIQEEERLLAQRLFDAEHSKTKLQIISRNSASSITNVGTTTAAQWGGNFIKNAPPPVKAKKGEIFKAARIPKDQLLDLIFDCFRQYQYWSMKALRQKLQQPDLYLRQVLEEIAVLHKSGRFANHYGLSDAYKDRAGSDAKEEAAEADEDEDEDEEMEDVLPGL